MTHAQQLEFSDGGRSYAAADMRMDLPPLPDPDPEPAAPTPMEALRMIEQERSLSARATGGKHGKNLERMTDEQIEGIADAKRAVRAKQMDALGITGEESQSVFQGMVSGLIKAAELAGGASEATRERASTLMNGTREAGDDGPEGERGEEGASYDDQYDLGG